MPDLTELQRLADLADLMPWERPGDVPYAHKKQFQDAMSPDTAKKLIAVALAAKNAMERVTMGTWRAANVETSALEALFAALEELK